jgi:hypothetical protein
MPAMATFRRIPRAPGSIGIALTLVDLWTKLTPDQRRRLAAATRTHGPSVLRAVTRAARRR